ncbi:hypothetical protein [Halalkalibacter lacteus]|uniref:hypothetical protein n=1 Tax=Halalkalibacter lacteus TaxID=3090663 RepID=UPI002FCA091A
MKEQPPFEEWGYKLIPSSYGELNEQKRYYRVSYGTSFWHTSEPDNIHRAFTIFVQFGTNPNFKVALKKGEIKIYYPCHILDVDMEDVLATMKELREEYKNNHLKHVENNWLK